MLQIGDTVIAGNLIGIVSFADDNDVILKCHDGLSHNVKSEQAQLLVSAADTLSQYEEAVKAYGRQEHK